MKQIFLDTETTGLKPSEGHRVVEVVALAYENRQQLPGEEGTFHEYCNPERDMPAEAENVHGMSTEFLSDKPRFAKIAAPLQAFLSGAELIIHNADFDCDFLDYEFGLLNMPSVREITHNVICTLNLSRRQHRALRRHRLEDLCKYYGVNDSARNKHSALIDSQLLAHVYRHMTRGQIPMKMALPPTKIAAMEPVAAAPVRLLLASATENAAHETYLEVMEKETGVRPLWHQ